MVRITLMELGKRPPLRKRTAQSPAQGQDFDRFNSGLGGASEAWWARKEEKVAAIAQCNKEPPPSRQD
jgi:hypothetical protein